MYEFFSRLLDWFMKTFFIGEINNLSNLKVDRPSIIVANHSSYFDHFALLYAFRKANNGDKLYFLAKAELFENPISRFWQVTMNAIPINRDGDNVETLNQMKHILKDEHKSIVIYPEGTRTYDGKVHLGKQGALVLAQITRAPIVPVGLEGGFDILPRKLLIPKRGKFNLNVGLKMNVRVSKANRDKVQNKLMNLLTELSHGMFENDDHSRIERMIYAAKEYNELGIRNYPDSQITSKQYHRRALYISNQLIKENQLVSQALVEKSRAIGKLGILSGINVWANMRLSHAKYVAYQALRLDNTNYMANYVIATCYNWLPRYMGGSKLKASDFYKTAIQQKPDNVFMHLSYAKLLKSSGNSKEALQEIDSILAQDADSQVDVRRQLEALAIKMRLERNYIPTDRWVSND